MNSARLHGLSISMQCADEQVQREWRSLFAYEQNPSGAGTSNPDHDILVEVEVSETDLRPPEGDPFYNSHYPPLNVYAQNGQEIVLCPSSQVKIRLNLLNPAESGKPVKPDAIVTLTHQILQDDGFEDVMTLALAPFFRRNGLFMIHAFAAALLGQAVLFVGPRGHGKTSSGLALVLDKWDFLANDIALMREYEGIEALLSPGSIHVSPQTGTFLPQLDKYFQHYSPHQFHGKVAIPRHKLLAQSKPTLSAKLNIVYFPEIGAGQEHKTEQIPRAVGLARLMEASIDQWDKDAWLNHVDFLERLSHQVQFRTLILGQNLPSLPDLLQTELE